MLLDKSAEVVMPNVKKGKMKERHVRVMWVIWSCIKILRAKR